MFSDLKPYPDYAEYDSDPAIVLPDRWEPRRIKTLVREVDRRTSTGAERLMSLRAIAGLVDHHAEGGKHIPPESLVGYKVVASSQVVMNRMRAASGVFGLADSSGLVSPDYAVFDVLHGSNPSYLLALFKSPLMRARFRSESKGLGTGESGFLRLYSDRFGAIEVPFPPESDQAAIVKYLGHANARIDRAIAAKRKLIALLEAQKQAIINQAVTRGLDPNVSMQDSGIPLGQIPSHWQVWPIGRLARVGNGSTPSRTTPEFWQDGNYPWLNSSFANKREVLEADQFVTTRALAECHLPIVPPESVIVAITGQGKTRGKAALLKMEATINQHLAYLTPDPRRLIGPFLQAVLVAAYPELRRISDDSGSTKGALTCQDLKVFRVPVPPLVEQAQIVQWIRDETETAEAAAGRAARQIELLREFRTRLTADVVTGQLDIRDAAARLPELDPADLVSDVGTDEDELDADLAASLEEVEA